MIMMTVSIVAYAVTPFSLMKSPSLCWRVASTIECIQQKKAKKVAKNHATAKVGRRIRKCWQKEGEKKWKKGGPGRALLDRRCFTTRQKETGGGKRNGIRQIIERKSTLHQDFVFTKLNFLFESYLTFRQLVAKKWDQAGDSAQDQKERRDILFLIR